MADPDWMTLGGWNPRFARVLAQAVLSTAGGALIDTNGDGAHLDFELAVLGETGLWQSYYDGIDVGAHGKTEFESYRLAWGHDTPGSQVDVQFSTAIEHVSVPRNGWWFVLHHDPGTWAEPEPLPPIPPEHAGKAYASTLTITKDDGRVYADEDARRFLFGSAHPE